MANPDIGTVKCPFCGRLAAVRKYKTGSRALYFVCDEGIIRPNSTSGQEWMLEHARMGSPADPTPAPEVANKAEQDPPAGIFDAL